MTRNPFRSILFPLMMFLLCACALTGSAIAATTNADCLIRFGGLTLDLDGGAGASSASCAGSRIVGSTSASGTATADASVGTLKAAASISANSITQSFTDAGGAWYDSITLSSNGASDGTLVDVLVGFFVVGTLDASENASASYALRFGVCANNPFCFAGTSLSAATVTATSGDPVVSTVIERTISVRLGELTGLSMQLNVTATKLETPGDILTGAASVEFANSVYWDGVRDVRLNGVSIPYTLVSGSGVDLTQSLRPVPLPATVWMFGSALCAFGGLRRLQSDRPASRTGRGRAA